MVNELESAGSSGKVKLSDKLLQGLYHIRERLGKMNEELEIISTRIIGTEPRLEAKISQKDPLREIMKEEPFFTKALDCLNQIDAAIRKLDKGITRLDGEF